MTTLKCSRISKENFTLRKIPLNVNVDELIFGNVAGIHLQILVRNKLLYRYIMKTTISKTFVSSNSHLVATKNHIYKGWGAFKRLPLPKPASVVCLENQISKSQE